MVNIVYRIYYLKQEKIVENDELSDLTTTEINDNGTRIKKINYGASVNALINEIIADSDENQIFVINPLGLMVKTLHIFQNIASYVYPTSICNKLYSEYAIFIFSKQHYILFNGLPNNYWGEYPSNKSLKDRINMTGLKQIEHYHELDVQNPDKLYNFDPFKNYKISKAKWYKCNIENDGYINNVTIQLNNLTEPYIHKLSEKDIYSNDNILEVFIDNLKERLRKLTKIYELDEELEISDIDWTDNGKYKSIKNMKINIKDTFKHVNYENDFINRLENEIDYILDKLYKPHNLQYKFRVNTINKSDKYYVNIKVEYIVGDLNKNQTKKIVNFAQINAPVLSEGLKLDEPLEEEMLGGDIKTVNIDLSMNDIDTNMDNIDTNMDILSTSNENNILNDKKTEHELESEHENNYSDDGGENKFCEKCGDEFRTYSGKNICVECREINSQEIDDIEIS
jgi:hypothetical protein